MLRTFSYYVNNKSQFANTFFPLSLKLPVKPYQDLLADVTIYPTYPNLICLDPSSVISNPTYTDLPAYLYFQCSFNSIFELLLENNKYLTFEDEQQIQKIEFAEKSGIALSDAEISFLKEKQKYLQFKRKLCEKLLYDYFYLENIVYPKENKIHKNKQRSRLEFFNMQRKLFNGFLASRIGLQLNEILDAFHQTTQLPNLKYATTFTNDLQVYKPDLELFNSLFNFNAKTRLYNTFVEYVRKLNDKRKKPIVPKNVEVIKQFIDSTNA